uniref:Adhesion G protein-coupled receptor G3 n=1 Tax=Rousettus aegyptiacus TaxID=9407 RepID=A0A7J8CDI3_ROUAE|nr:adhesion G protein-coupled receptor G3 [Rousettus aegyptiacus]
MVTPGALRVPLLVLPLLLASGQKNSTSEPNISELPRKVCLGIINMDLYETFYLRSTAKCFTKCKQSKYKSCDLGNLQRYWVDYETHLVEESMTETVDLSFLKTSVKNFSTNISEDVHFSLTPSQLPRQVMEDEQKPADRVRLPRSLFATLQGSRATVRLAISVLDIGPGDLFKGPQLSLEDSGSVLNNRLVGLSVGRMRVTGLAEPLEIAFSHQPQPPNMTLTCVFWDVAKGPTGDWSSEGCSTEPGAKQTVCHCDHLTFFALLLRPVLDKDTAQTLTRISQAGCGASMIFLAFTIILYTALRPASPNGHRHWDCQQLWPLHHP